MTVKYEVKFTLEDAEIYVRVYDEEGMNEDEIATEAQVTLQRQGVTIDINMVDSITVAII